MNELAKILRETAAKLNAEADKLDPVVVRPTLNQASATFVGIPTSVDQISYKSRSDPAWAKVSEAVMRREQALADGKAWDAYQGPEGWPAHLLGPGGAGKQPWE